MNWLIGILAIVGVALLVLAEKRSKQPGKNAGFPASRRMRERKRG